MELALERGDDRGEDGGEEGIVISGAGKEGRAERRDAEKRTAAARKM